MSAGAGSGDSEPTSGELSADDARTGDAAAIALARARSERPSPRGATIRPRRTRRGGDPIFSGPAPDERDPQALSAAVGNLAAVAGWQSRLAVAALTLRWAEVVGSDVARHSRLAGFDTRTGEVLVIADSPAWASALRMCSATVLDRIREVVGEGVVSTLTIRFARLGEAEVSYPPTSG